MAWTCKFIQDTEVDGLGTMQAEYTDPKSGDFVVSYQQRMKNGDDTQAGPFINSAQAVLQKAQDKLAKDQAQQDLAVLLAAKLNS